MDQDLEKAEEMEVATVQEKAEVRAREKEEVMDQVLGAELGMVQVMGAVPELERGGGTGQEMAAVKVAVTAVAKGLEQVLEVVMVKATGRVVVEVRVVAPVQETEEAKVRGEERALVKAGATVLVEVGVPAEAAVWVRVQAGAEECTSRSSSDSYMCLDRDSC